MKTKTAYREPRKIPAAENSAPDIPESVQPSASTTIDFNTDKAEPTVTIVGDAGEPGDAVTEALQKAVEADEASEALRRQLQHLHVSEALVRRHAEQMAQQAQRPMSREEKLATWRANGGDEGDISFLESHPEMIDRHDVTVVAAEAAAQQGFQRGTDDHRQATKEIFDRHLGHQQAQPAASVGPASTPEFFRPPPAPSQERPGAASYVSAPVSRREVGGYREPSLRSVKLSALEQEMARNLGLSDVQYAEGKIALLKRKASGELQ